ncbi:CbrC family protein [Kitasatospora aureofaciens]
MIWSLPVFPYHPDPLGTGVVLRSDAECSCCEQVRGTHLAHSDAT